MKNYKLISAAELGRLRGELQSEIQLRQEAETELARTKQLLQESRAREARLVERNAKVEQARRDAEISEDHARRVVAVQHAVIGFRTPAAAVPPVWSQLRLQSGLLSWRVRTAGSTHFRQYAVANGAMLENELKKRAWLFASLAMRLCTAESAGALSGAYLLELVSEARRLSVALFNSANGIFQTDPAYWRAIDPTQPNRLQESGPRGPLTLGATRTLSDTRVVGDDETAVAA